MTLNDAGVRGANPPLSQKPSYNFRLPQNLTAKSSLCMRGGMVPEPPWIPKSADAQVLYIKCCR